MYCVYACWTNKIHISNWKYSVSLRWKAIDHNTTLQIVLKRTIIHFVTFRKSRSMKRRRQISQKWKHLRLRNLIHHAILLLLYMLDKFLMLPSIRFHTFLYSIPDYSFQSQSCKRYKNKKEETITETFHLQRPCSNWRARSARCFLIRISIN